ncbi:hypothetical protein QJS66_22435 [Kocuria rhizophila]|nr:hypothetical protein QJS66_22435 [Kocuria rhizophila]
MTCGAEASSRSSPRRWPSTTWGRNAAWPTRPSPAPRRCWASGSVYRGTGKQPKAVSPFLEEARDMAEAATPGVRRRTVG